MIYIGRKLKQSQREIIQKFRQLHLTQQSRERAFLDKRKLDAAKIDDAGNPISLFLFEDGFTIYTCQTPKFPHSSKGDKVIETRIVGIEVVCGPIKTVLVYRTDELISGGANITIELTRQALIDASILLRQRSLLYTHASIDQYFSVISRAIKRAKFIGTPMALLELIRRCHDDSWRQPAVIREIKVYYNMKAMFAPYINKRLKYYNLPHIYKFIPSFGHTAICLYKDDSSMPHWKPAQPAAKITDIDSLIKSSEGSESIYIPDLSAVGGTSEFMKFLGLGDSRNPVLAQDLLGKDKEIARLQEVNKLLPELEQLSLRSLEQQAQRMHDESDGVEVRKAYAFRQGIQRKLLNLNNSKERYIIWLDLAAKKVSNIVIFIRFP